MCKKPRFTVEIHKTQLIDIQDFHFRLENSQVYSHFEAKWRFYTEKTDFATGEKRVYAKKNSGATQSSHLFPCVRN